MVKTLPCQLLVYGETTGGPVCICSAEAANQWQGTEHEESLYWEVTAKMGLDTFFRYSANYAFFNTETGNFALFRSVEALVLVEIISIEAEATIPWQGLEFTLRPQTYSPVHLLGLTCFFDSSLSIQGCILPQESIYASGPSSMWNTVLLECDYLAAYEVTFDSDTMHLAGVCFLKTA
jgi:hypothetical protein